MNRPIDKPADRRRPELRRNWRRPFLCLSGLLLVAGAAAGYYCFEFLLASRALRRAVAEVRRSVPQSSLTAFRSEFFNTGPEERRAFERLLKSFADSARQLPQASLTGGHLWGHMARRSWRNYFDLENTWLAAAAGFAALPQLPLKPDGTDFEGCLQMLAALEKAETNRFCLAVAEGDSQTALAAWETAAAVPRHILAVAILRMDAGSEEGGLFSADLLEASGYRDRFRTFDRLALNGMIGKMPDELLDRLAEAAGDEEILRLEFQRCYYAAAEIRLFRPVEDGSLGLMSGHPAAMPERLRIMARAVRLCGEAVHWFERDFYQLDGRLLQELRLLESEARWLAGQPIGSDGFRRFNELIADIRMCRVVIALEKYRRACGGFPERLEDLVPEFLSEVPVDPLDGGPVKYLRGWRRIELIPVDPVRFGPDAFDDGLSSGAVYGAITSAYGTVAMGGMNGDDYNPNEVRRAWAAAIFCGGGGGECGFTLVDWETAENSGKPAQSKVPRARKRPGKMTGSGVVPGARISPKSASTALSPSRR